MRLWRSAMRSHCRAPLRCGTSGTQSNCSSTHWSTSTSPHRMPQMFRQSSIVRMTALDTGHCAAYLGSSAYTSKPHQQDCMGSAGPRSSTGRRRAPDIGHCTACRGNSIRSCKSRPNECKRLRRTPMRRAWRENLRKVARESSSWWRLGCSRGCSYKS